MSSSAAEPIARKPSHIRRVAKEIDAGQLEVPREQLARTFQYCIAHGYKGAKEDVCRALGTVSNSKGVPA